MKNKSNDFETRIEMFEANIAFATYIVNKYFKSQIYSNLLITREDLIQEAYLALWQATEYYDSLLGSFSTYASSYIQGSLLTFIRNNTYQMKLSRSQYYELIKYKKLKQLPESELSDEDKLFLKSYSMMYLDNSKISSLDYEISDERGSTTKLSDIAIPLDPTSKISEFDLELSLDMCIDTILSKIKSKPVRDLYEEYVYRCITDDPVTQIELAKKYGFTQSYASRIISKYNKMLYKLLNS